MPIRVASLRVALCAQVIPVNVFIILNQIIKMMTVKQPNGHRLNEVRRHCAGTSEAAQ